MSLAITLVGVDGIVMASDSREMAQAGGIDYHRDDVHKLQNLTERIGVLSVGNYVGFANWLLHFFETVSLYKITYDSKDITELSDIFSQFLLARYEMYSKGVSPSWLALNENLIDFTIAGYTKEGRPQIIRLNNIGHQLPFAPELLDEPYYFSGKTSVAYHLARKFELEQPIKTMNTELLKRVATLMIIETAKIDDHVSPPIDMAVIKQGSSVEYVNKDRVVQLIRIVDKGMGSEVALGVLRDGTL